MNVDPANTPSSSAFTEFPLNEYCNRDSCDWPKACPQRDLNSGRAESRPQIHEFMLLLIGDDVSSIHRHLTEAYDV